MDWAAATADEIAAAIRRTEWELQVWLPSELAKTTNARRLASLRRHRAEASQSLSRMVTELGAKLQER